MTSRKKLTRTPTFENRKAKFNYSLLDKYTAGIMLTGTEIKSIRRGKANLQDAYCYFFKNELWVKHMHIAPYEQGNIYNHQEDRERKLLLTHKELDKLMKNKEKGLTIIPLLLFIDSNNRAKLTIALAKGKKLYDKRQSTKERDIQRALARKPWKI